MKLYCGHQVPDSLYSKMFATKIVRCPKCGMTWRGWSVIGHDRAEARRARFDEARRGRESKNKR